jgi:ubiquinone biosynthesis protein Coq4
MNNLSTLSLSLPSTISLKWHLSFKTLAISSFVLLLLSIVLCVIQLNDVTRSSFAVSNLEEQVSELTQGNQRLAAGMASFSSSLDMETILASLNYEKTGQVRYIKIMADTALAGE